MFCSRKSHSYAFSHAQKWINMEARNSMFTFVNLRFTARRFWIISAATLDANVKAKQGQTVLMWINTGSDVH